VQGQASLRRGHCRQARIARRGRGRALERGESGAGTFGWLKCLW
jgi:hypothetical protein